MNLYARKKRWKWFLFASAVVIVALSLWYTHVLVRKIALDERTNIEIWADAIQKKAELVNYTEVFFKQLQDEERKRVELLADAYHIITIVEDETLNFFTKVISQNSTIPIIQTDSRGKIKNAVNVNFDHDTVEFLKGDLRAEFMVYPPIKIAYNADQFDYLFYKESTLFTELRVVMDDLIESFFSEIVINSASVPVIITDSTKKLVIAYGMLDPEKAQDSTYMVHTLQEMANDNKPIVIDLVEQGKRYVYYKDSELLTRLMFFPYLQLGIIMVFLFIAYILFSSARKSEQNQVWVGLAKETAHQIGTPLSSMIGWIELLKMDGVESDAITELNKDVERLHKITDRFSKIGAEPKLRKTNIVSVIYDSVDYIESRISRKVLITIKNDESETIYAPINLHLFEWVIENVCKNAVDAVVGDGTIEIEIIEEPTLVMIDIHDNGKGIPKSQYKSIFNPGYTSKKRGWGLGLSLAKRIINEYHNGKIFVKNSTINKGSTFRIMLRKEK